MLNNKRFIFLDELNKISKKFFFIGEIVEFKKEKSNLKRNLLISGGLLTSGITLAVLAKNKKVNNPINISKPVVQTSKQLPITLPSGKIKSKSIEDQIKETLSKSLTNNNNNKVEEALSKIGVKSDVGVKSYIRNGKIVKAHKKRVLKVKPKSNIKEVKDEILSTNKEQYILEPVNKIESTKTIDIFEKDLNDLDFTNSESFDILSSKYNFSAIDDLYFTESPSLESLSRILKNKFSKDNNITKYERKALVAYIRNEHKKLNEFLTTGIAENSNISETIKDLDSCLDKLPKYKGEKLYRYVKIDDSKKESIIKSILNNYQKGNIIDEPRYMSTTSDSIFDDEWLKESPVRFIIKPKKQNTKARDIRFFNHEEKEVLFQRNTKFKVGNTRNSKDDKWEGYEIELEEI